MAKKQIVPRFEFVDPNPPEVVVEALKKILIANLLSEHKIHPWSEKRGLR